MSKLLVLGDSPTTETGFARVLQNLLTHWQSDGRFEEIDVWAIGYAGWPHKLPYNLLPAQTYAHHSWYDEANLQRFLERLHTGGYTHVFLLQDLFHLCRIGKSLGEICRKQGIRSLLYYPVDASLDDLWVEPLAIVDVAVAYTEYGYAEAKKRKGMGNLKKLILPHGTDLAKYYPLLEDGKARDVFTDTGGRPIVRQDDLLISVVSAHQRRKGLSQSLQVFSELVKDPPQGRQLWLYMHMPSINPDEGSNLRSLAIQLGIEKQVLFADNAFVGNVSRLGEEFLCMVYNASDLLLTTTHGEGWGLPITEAMACGTPVAGPRHTAVAELLNLGADTIAGYRGIGLPCANTFVTLTSDMMRLRPVVNAPAAAEEIYDAVAGEYSGDDRSLPEIAGRAFEWVMQPQFRWQHIADEWLDLMFP